MSTEKEIEKAIHHLEEETGYKFSNREKLIWENGFYAGRNSATEEICKKLFREKNEE